MNKPLHDESELFRLIASGDERAYEIFFELYKGRLLTFLTRITKSAEEAKELTQEIFVQIWRTRTTLTAIDTPGGYVFAMARNKALDYLRKVAADARMKENLWKAMERTRHLTEEEVIATESARIIQEAIYKLPEKRQTVFRLSRLEGLSHDEIALHLSISKNTVKNHIIASLKFIKTYLGHR